MFSPIFFPPIFLNWNRRKNLMSEKAFFLSFEHVKKIGEDMWWVDQKIVNGDKQKNETQSEFSCIFKVFVAIPRDIVITTTLQSTYLHQNLYSKIFPSRCHLFVEKMTILVTWLSSHFLGIKIFVFKIDCWNFQDLFAFGFHGQDSSFLNQQIAPWWRNFWVKILTYIIHIVSEERRFFLKVFADYSMPLLDNYNKKGNLPGNTDLV